jgi:hypothetical protein
LAPSSLRDSKQPLLLDYFVNQASSRAASYHTVSMKALLCITAKLRADVAEGQSRRGRLLPIVGRLPQRSES